MIEMSASRDDRIAGQIEVMSQPALLAMGRSLASTFKSLDLHDNDDSIK